MDSPFFFPVIVDLEAITGAKIEFAEAIKKEGVDLNSHYQYVVAECERRSMTRTSLRFSRRTLREAINWGDTQLKIHLARLLELEYLVAHRTHTNGFDYELVYDVAGAGDTLRFPGLADIDALARAYDAGRSGQGATRSAHGRGAVGPWSVGGRVDGSSAEPASTRVSDDATPSTSKTHSSTPPRKRTPYPQAVAAPALAAGA